MVNCSGVLLLNKPVGISSNRALQVSKRLLSIAKAGHTGTLDPMAQGLLPICLGEATKFSSVVLSVDKTYIASLRLGYISNTGDAEGEISRVAKPDAYPPDPQQVIAILQTFLGRSNQIPPMFSALKLHGKPLYRYAREGVTIARKAREIIIYNISLNALSDFEMVVDVRCSSGTYIRTLAEDIGKALGYGGAYLTALSRTGVGHFDLSQACSLDQLESRQPPDRLNLLYPIDSLLSSIPSMVFDDKEVVRLQQGQKIRKSRSQSLFLTDSRLRLYDSENIFIGLGEWADSETIVPKRMIVPTSFYR
ncbi:tRNA pseudouridine(55) synthase TruB [Nitrosomonas sp. HPC101]|uniref:tRNA pseudouridine(55) synthase TruB n=1 Tax=Nitrosomonas sp. HPC101 TaxID=1658667 RepID=UPI0013DE78B3|nr:tRNA pseudouridine(55) synthase TruB [Nitrosomonas sp. HPC101]